MTIESATHFFGWCTIINIGFLMWWALFVVFASELTYKTQSKFFKMSREQFTLIHYGGIGLFKMGVILFNVVPYFALRIIAP